MALRAGLSRGDKRDRVLEGFNTWTNISDAVLSYEKLTEASTSYNRFDCNDSPYNGIFWGAVGSIQGYDVLGESLVCSHSSSNSNINNAVHHFSVVFDYTQSDFHSGASNGPNTLNDFGGVATHEAGHTGGFTGEYGAGWDICTGDPKATMCGREAEKVPYGYRTLEFHDTDGFKSVY